MARVITNPQDYTLKDLRNYDWDVLKLNITFDTEPLLGFFEDLKTKHSESHWSLQRPDMEEYYDQRILSDPRIEGIDFNKGEFYGGKLYDFITNPDMNAFKNKKKVDYKKVGILISDTSILNSNFLSFALRFAEFNNTLAGHLSLYILLRSAQPPYLTTIYSSMCSEFFLLHSFKYSFLFLTLVSLAIAITCSMMCFTRYR
jgi:hypothetical protein